MRADLIPGLFAAMQNCEDRGDYRTMRVHLKRSGLEIANEGDEPTLRELAKLLLRVITAIDIEAEQGAGTLLKPDHPDNIAWPKVKWHPLRFR
ncbi:hypothetical protein [Agrobacterium tumefaciens]|uniref:hypothetical protein n=1 Tax=Agrobacterium tumefaciens TaxID=358 RepID=UPI0021D06D55|nr:hypothetical protein [Agrobacterium tumefaciens]UXS45885.1 hypothetical protein FY149_01055 [Agrobacterium tumefaciens]